MLPSDFLRSLRSILVTVALLLPVWLGAQNVTLNLKDVSVQEAVTQLQSQGNYTIVISAGATTPLSSALTMWTCSGESLFPPKMRP